MRQLADLERCATLTGGRQHIRLGVTKRTLCGAESSGRVLPEWQGWPSCAACLRVAAEQANAKECD